ncbi:MAG TPA: alpha/beta fold hydrolase [Gemmatimonadaceae bacterium]|nr:alpha/beta fold hydrolase [Gemmatimonadaceae bacterium]
MLPTAVGTAAAAALLWVQRAMRATLRERRFGQRFRLGAEGIVAGAEPRTYEAPGNRALLLLHGYNDSPQSLDQVARVIHAAGWTVRLPLMPGHGRSLRAFDQWTEQELLAHAREEFTKLRTTHRTVVVGGLSMGGALACWLAAESDAAGVVLYAPMLFVPRPMQVAVSTARLWSLFSKYVSGGGKRSIHDAAAAKEMIAYGASTRRSFEALERLCLHTTARLGFIHSPVLVVQSEEDNRLPRDQSVHAIARIGSNDKTVMWTRGAGHVVTVDTGWKELADSTVRWLESRFPVSSVGATDAAS